MTLLAFSVLAVDSAASLIACLNASNVPLISTSDADYAPAVIPYNLRLPFFPAAIAVPTTAAHVSSALKCAQTFNTKVAARSGGHSYAAFGLGGVDGSLMIDMKKFRNLTVDPDTFVATVGAGLRLGDIASGIHAIAGRALPHGLCPGVGISGHALHGGFGFTSRMWGTTLGTIIEMEVVLASGEIVNVSKESNPDLFWALRGAGSSFGIVTTFKLKTYPAPASGINFTWTWTLDNNATATVDTKVKLFQAVQDYSITTAPSNMALRVFTVPMMGLFQITGVFWGSREDFDSVIAPLVDSFPDQDNIPTPEVLEHAYLDLLVVLALGQALPQPENYTMHDTFFAKSIVAPSKLTTNALTSFFTFHGQNANKPPLLWFVIANLYGGQYSAISAQDPADSSYYVRDSLFTFQLYSNLDTTTDPPVTTYPPWGIEFMDGLSKSMTDAQTETKFHAYPNYVDPTLSPQLAHELYYGENYPRLASLKGVFDPGFLLWNPQAVGTS
ncbi:FAD-binding domain-containing protein [Choiromyces venosus 120613-1]|uniref:FAD-binding domain-containing protein n=1 Tax=Choiromyces venosus 120613-1 TaxID=1336337 RepID=A0A3N4JBH9_9PEZI|nr:FAD-binding domain-containing protein [Choiromyces venosus 120613-1]